MEENLNIVVAGFEDLERTMRNMNQEALQTMKGMLMEFAERIEKKLGAFAAETEERHVTLEGRVTTLEAIQSPSTVREIGQGVSKAQFPAQGHSTTPQSYSVFTSSRNIQNLPVCNADSMHYSSTTLQQAELPASTFTTSTTSWVAPVPSSSDFIPQVTYHQKAMNNSSSSTSITSCMPSSSSTSLNVTQAVPLSTAITSSTVSIAGGTNVLPMDCDTVPLYYSSTSNHHAEFPAYTLTSSTAPSVVPVSSSSYFIPQSTCHPQAAHFSTTSAYIPSCMPSSSSTTLNVTQAAPFSMEITSSAVSVAGGTGVSQTDSALRKSLGERLVKAAFRRDIEEVQRLLEAGADVNFHFSGCFGYTPLHVAARRSYIDVMNLLMSAGADMNRQCPKGKTPLHLAACKGRSFAISVLLTVGADANIQDEFGNSPMHDAVIHKDETSTRALINGGANMNLQTVLGNTPLLVAVLHNKEKHAMELISAGASLTVRNNEGESPLHWASHYNQVTVVQALATRTDRNVQTNEGNTPLHYAVRNGSLESLQVLISAGELVDVQNANEETPLHWARRGNNETIVRLLINAGGSESIRDKFGITPGDYA